MAAKMTVTAASASPYHMIVSTDNRDTGKEAMMFSIYLSRPLTGCSYEEVTAYYDAKEELLRRLGYLTLCPLPIKDFLRLRWFRAEDDRGFPVTRNHAIIERDRWMVNKADILLLDLIGARAVSIGCVMELAWAHDRGKHTVVVLEDENVHQHPFALEAADIMFPEAAAAYDYLVSLGRWRADDEQ
jgi:nucleoside 2-deoxyribosyltransferase